MTDITAHPLDQALRLAPLGEHRFRGETTAPWANMVGPFGGVTAAVLLRAAMDHPERFGDPLALTVNYAGPVAAGAATLAAQGTRPVLACARGVSFAQGFFEQRAEVWGDGGTLLASSVQVVYYRD